MLQQTDNTKTDITNIMQELGKIGNNDSIANALNTSAYGTLSVEVPFQQGVFTASFTHNLGYAPAFITKTLTGTIGFDIPEVANFYSYVAGLKGSGGYPLINYDSYVDTQKLYVSVFNNPNLPGFFEEGIVVFSYLIFSRPLSQ